jgi:hypothetical protein
VLVDDDSSDARFGFPDVGTTLSTAIQSTTGAAPQEIDVAYRSDGPSLAQLQGKTVVWATGRAYLSDDDGFFITKTTLTEADQQTLISFLNGGGRLVLTGMDAMYLIETSPLVSKTLKIGVDGDVTGKTTFAGSLGTAFPGSRTS